MPSAFPTRAVLPTDLTEAITRAGYYPAVVCDVVSAALASEEVVSHLVHQETTFAHEAIRRHITVLVLTPTRLVVAHADDHPDEAPTSSGEVATATTESIPLSGVTGVMLTHIIADPQSYVPGTLGRELTLSIGWGAVSRVDLLPAACSDPNCDADHGYDGTITADDISLRISAEAEGATALAAAIDFSSALSGAIGPRPRG